MQTSTIQQKILGALSALAMLFAASALVSCSSDSSESEVETSVLSSVSIEGRTVIGAAESITLTAKPTFTGTDNSSSVTYKWEITQEDGTAADLSEYAYLDDSTAQTAKINGVSTDRKSKHTVTVKVTATYNGISKEGTKTITVAAIGVNEIASVSISSSSSSIANKGTSDLTASYEYAGSVSDFSYSWKITKGGDYASLSSTTEKEVTLTGNNQTSSPQTVKVKVTVSGKISDSATISKESDEISIEVGAASVTSVTLSETTLSLVEGKDSTLTATVEGTNLPDSGKTVTWESSDTAVATVSDGKVTAVKAGSAKITATSTFDTSKSASCTVTVKEASSSTTNYISASDTPVGYAEIDTSKFATTVTVSSKSDLVKYASAGGYLIYVSGMIDMSEGMLPTTGGGSTTALDTFVKSTASSYSTYAAYKAAYVKACSKTTNDKNSSSPESSVGSTMWALNNAYGNKIKLTVASNTAIIGLTSSSGIKGGTIQVNGVSNVVIRNILIQDAYDPFPHHEKNDGYNAQWDGITVQGSCSNIWIDHCTFQDTMDIYDVSTGGSTTEKYQTYDGACDMKGSGAGITISYCKFYNHDKTMLIGSDDDEGSSSTRKITLHHNYFLDCEQRLPMVRNTTIHIFNNYFDFDSNGFYKSSYAVGARKGSIIYSENNYFGNGIQYSFSAESGSKGTLYLSGDSDNSSKGMKTKVISSSGTTLFSSAVNAYIYSHILETASDAKTTVEENAGAGVWSVNQ